MIATVFNDISSRPNIFLRVCGRLVKLLVKLRRRLHAIHAIHQHHTFGRVYAQVGVGLDLDLHEGIAVILRTNPV